jgi:chromosome segregation ATPase
MTEREKLADQVTRLEASESRAGQEARAALERAARLEGELAASREAAQTLGIQRDQLSQQLTVAATERERLAGQVARLETSEAAARAAVTSLETERDQLRGVVAEATTLRQQLTAAGAERDKLADQIARLEGSERTAGQEARAALERAARMEGELAGLRQAVKAIEALRAATAKEEEPKPVAGSTVA